MEAASLSMQDAFVSAKCSAPKVWLEGWASLRPSNAHDLESQDADPV